MKKLAVLFMSALLLTGVLHADLVTHLAFEGDLIDSGPGGNDGTIVGGDGSLITFVEGVDGTPESAVSFASPTVDSTEGRDFIQLATNNGLPLTDEEEFTIAMWVKGPVQQDNRIFSESYTQGNNTPLFNLGTDNNGTNSQFDFFYRPASGTTVNHRHSDRDAFDDTWHHIAWVEVDGTATLYIDGVPDAVNFSYTRGTLPKDATTIGGIMRGTACCQYTGTIDEVYLYNHALTQEDVQTLMGVPSFCPAEGDPDFADTHLTNIEFEGPPNNLPGSYAITATATDDTDNEILYMFVADNGEGEELRAGPGLESTANLVLSPGTWTVTVTVDDELRCFDQAADAVDQVEITVDGTPQLISHWTFDGTLDDTGDAQAANDGVFVGDVAPTFTEGYDGTPDGAILLDGVDDYVDVMQNGGLPIYTTSAAYTVCMWVKGPHQRDMRVFAEASLTSTNPLVNIGCQAVDAGAAGEGTVRIYMRGSGSPTFAGDSDRVAFDDTWHHLAWVDDGGTAVLYIDGVRDAGDMNYIHPAMELHTTTIGGILRGTGPSHWFEGAIDDVRIYNYALTQEEVLQTFPEPDTCPDEGDTHCSSLALNGPDGNVEGVYTATCDAVDDTEDAILYTFMLYDGEGAFVQQAGPQLENTAQFVLVPGDWTVAVSVDDAILCRDVAADATCSETTTVFTEAPAMIAHFPFDGTLEDAVGGNNGSVVSYVDTSAPEDPAFFERLEETPLFYKGIDCTGETAVSLNGGNLVYINYAEETSLPLTTRSAFSIAMWVKGPANQSDRRIFSESSSTSNNPLFNIGTHNTGEDGTVDVYIRPNSGTILEHTHSIGTAFDDTWHHIVWTDDEGQGVLYIDGVADPTEFTYTRAPATYDTTTIGGILREGSLPNNPSGYMFDGEIDDVLLYNYILAQSEIDELYGEGPSFCCPLEGDAEYADTHCQGLSHSGGPGEGTYTVTCTAIDDTDDDILYTFSADDGAGTVLAPASQDGNMAQFDLTEGTWTVTCTVDDDPECDDAAADATCTDDIVVTTGGEVLFRRGFVNSDDSVNIADAVAMLSYLFAGGEEPACKDAADANDDEGLNIADAVTILGYLFGGAGTLPEPFETCGVDPTPGDPDLGCESFPSCK